MDSPRSTSRPVSRVAKLGDGANYVDPLVARLTEIRLNRGIKRRTVAACIGCSLQYLGRAERGTVQPTLHILRLWAAALGVRLDLEVDPSARPTIARPSN